MLSFNIILIASVFSFPIIDQTFDAQLHENKPHTGYLQEASNDDQEVSNDENVDDPAVKRSYLPEIHASSLGPIAHLSNRKEPLHS
jgi:hypothetical protein